MHASKSQIYRDTLRRCINEQYFAAECHLHATTWMQPQYANDPNAIRAAVREQLIGAYHAAEASWRLDRLNGHA
jgi:hypothetical protein